MGFPSSIRPKTGLIAWTVFELWPKKLISEKLGPELQHLNYSFDVHSHTLYIPYETRVGDPQCTSAFCWEYTYVYIYIYTYTHTYMYVFIYIYIHTYIYVCTINHGGPLGHQCCWLQVPGPPEAWVSIYGSSTAGWFIRDNRPPKKMGGFHKWVYPKMDVLMR